MTPLIIFLIAFLIVFGSFFLAVWNDYSKGKSKKNTGDRADNVYAQTPLLSAILCVLALVVPVIVMLYLFL